MKIVKQWFPQVGVIVLFAFAPFLSFLADNYNESLDMDKAITYASVWALLLALVASFFWVLKRGKTPERVTLPICVLSVVFFSYNLLEPFSKHLFKINALWLGVLVVAMGLAYLFSRLAISLQAVGVMGLILSGLPLAQLLPNQGIPVEARQPSYEKNVTSTPADTTRQVRKPNVYFVILDEYARHDVLKDVVKFDNSAFLNSMRDKGFYIADKSTSNYPMTWLSISSTLDMALQLPAGKDQLNVNRKPIYEKIAGKNRVVEEFKRRGYQYLHAGSGIWHVSNCKGYEDECLTTPVDLSELELSLLAKTPIKANLQTYAPDYLQTLTSERFTSLQDVTNRLKSANLTQKSPFFLFAHINAPHPPYRFERNCQLRQTMIENNITDNPEGLYSDAISCINQQVKAFVSTIQAKDPSDPIIIVQGDHGSAFQVHWKTPLGEWPQSYYQERFSILNAIRFPEACQKNLYPSVTSVNTFPLVFGCLDNKPPKLLPDYSFLASYYMDDIRLWEAK